jgi:hypothetical protein
VVGSSRRCSFRYAGRDTGTEFRASKWAPATGASAERSASAAHALMAIANGDDDMTHAHGRKVPDRGYVQPSGARD